MSEAVTATLQQDSSERRRAAYLNLLDAPPHRVAEVVDGVLHTNPRPAMRHAHAGSGPPTAETARERALYAPTAPRPGIIVESEPGDP